MRAHAVPEAPAARFEERPATSRQAACAELLRVLGAEHVVAQAEQAGRLARDTAPDSFAHAPVAFVYPGSREEVQAAVRIAARFQVPLWPCSQGKNWGYGASAPGRDGGIILNLRRMNRILEVRETLGYAVIEPGVTYRQLHAHLRATGSRLWSDCTDGPPDGSVLGNALERGIGETPYGDHFGNLCGLEAVLPDATVLRTGGAPESGSRVAHTYKWGRGPYLEGLLSQSNFGIVTQAGLWLMPAPEDFRSVLFDLRDESGFPALVDALRELSLAGIVQTKLHLINAVVTRAVLGPAASGALPPWSFGAGVYGTRADVRAKCAALRRALTPLGRLTILSDRDIARIRRVTPWLTRLARRPLLGRPLRALLRRPAEALEALPHFHQLLKGEPTEYFVRHAYFKAPVPRPSSGVDPARDGCGLLWFAPLAPLTSGHVSELLALCAPLFARHGFEFYVALLAVNPRTAVILMSIFFRKEDAGESARAAALYGELRARAEAAGFPQYRIHAARMEEAFEAAPAYRRTVGALKAALDPLGILAPGRYGIAG